MDSAYNTKLVVLSRLFKWHYVALTTLKEEKSYQHLIESQTVLSALENSKEEISCFKPSDLWSQKDDLLFS
jgi:hypothetical protein